MTHNDYASEIRTVRSELKMLKDDVEKLSDNILDGARSKTNNAKNEANARHKHATEKLAGRGVRSKETISGKVASRPLVSLAATAGAGLAIGALLRR